MTKLTFFGKIVGLGMAFMMTSGIVALCCNLAEKDATKHISYADCCLHTLFFYVLLNAIQLVIRFCMGEYSIKEVIKNIKNFIKSFKIKKDIKKLDRRISNLKVDLRVKELEKQVLSDKIESYLNMDFTEAEKEKYVCQFLDESNKLDLEMGDLNSELDLTVQQFRVCRHNLNIVGSSNHPYFSAFEQLDEYRNNLMNQRQQFRETRERLQAMIAGIDPALENAPVIVTYTDNNGITYNAQGAVIDGHHRLNALRNLSNMAERIEQLHNTIEDNIQNIQEVHDALSDTDEVITNIREIEINTEIIQQEIQDRFDNLSNECNTFPD